MKTYKYLVEINIPNDYIMSDASEKIKKLIENNILQDVNDSNTIVESILVKQKNDTKK